MCYLHIYIYQPNSAYLDIYLSTHLPSIHLYSISISNLPFGNVVQVVERASLNCVEFYEMQRVFASVDQGGAGREGEEEACRVLQVIH